MSRLCLSGRLGLLLMLASPLAADDVAPPEPQPVLPDGLYAVWHTARGTITARLEYELAPLAVANFVGLAEGALPLDVEGKPAGRPFYDGLTFHRVVPGFVAQGGDPLGTGEGDTGTFFADEFSQKLKHDAPGVLAMANSGPNTNSCQFYFTLVSVNRLNYKHTVFGRVVNGMSVVRKLEKGDKMDRVEIVRVGAAAEAYHPDAATFERLRAAARVIPQRDPALPPLFVSEGVPDLPEWAPAWLNEKLAHYQAITGNTVFARTFLDWPTGLGTDAAERLESLHQSLTGGDPRAVTLVYTASDYTWRVKFGSELLGRLGFTEENLCTDYGRAQFDYWLATTLADANSDVQSRKVGRSVSTAITAVTEALDKAALATPAE